MLQQGLDPWRFDVEVTMAGWLAAEVLSRVEKSTPGSSVLGWCLPAATYTRYLCKRLRARFPTLPIIVGCWGGTIDEAETLARLYLDRLTQIGITLTKTRQQFMQSPHI